MFDGLQDELFKAIGNEDVEACQVAFAKGADVNFHRPQFYTPLEKAVLNNSVDVCRWLIASGADTNAKDSLQWTALFHASSAAVCHLLIDLGADVSVRDRSGHTPLHYVARSADLGACQALVERGADVMAVSDDGATVLHGALWSGGSRNGVRVDMVALCRYFIEQGVSSSFIPPAPHNGYLTPFQYAVKQGDVDVVAMFCDECGEDPGQMTVGGRSMRQLASKQSKMKELLLRKGPEYAVKSSIDRRVGVSCVEPRGRSSGMAPI